MLDGALGGPVDQEYLLQARQMQALSFAVHIPLVCFGIAFPAMVLFLEGLWLRTGDPLYRALAKRWSKAMLDPVRHRGRDRHDPVLRARPAVARVHGHLRRRLRLRLRPRGLLVLHRGDLHRHLRLRLGPPAAEGPHPLRHPDRDLRHDRVAVRDLGQRLDERPHRLQDRERRGHRHRAAEALFNDNFWHELVHMYLAGYIVAGFLVAARLRLPAGCAASAIAATASAWSCAVASPRWPPRCSCWWATGPRARWPRTSRPSSPLRGAAEDREGRAAAHLRQLPGRRGEVRHRVPRPAVAAGLPRPGRHGAGTRRCRPNGAAAGSTSCGSRSSRWCASAASWPHWPLLVWSWWRRRRAARLALVLPRGGGRRARSRWWR